MTVFIWLPTALGNETVFGYLVCGEQVVLIRQIALLHAKKDNRVM